MKIPEFPIFYDGLQENVAEDVDTDTIEAGNFSLKASTTLTNWPSAGTFSIYSRLYTYDSISDDTFVNCNGPYGDRDVIYISNGEDIYQSVPSSIVNGLIDTVSPLFGYQTKDETGLTLTVSAGKIFDDTTELDFSEDTIELTDDSTNYVYIYNDSGTATLALDNTSWDNIATAYVPVCKVVTASSEVSSIEDCRTNLPAGKIVQATGSSTSGSKRLMLEIVGYGESGAEPTAGVYARTALTPDSFISYVELAVNDMIILKGVLPDNYEADTGNLKLRLCYAGSASTTPEVTVLAGFLDDGDTTANYKYYSPSEDTLTATGAADTFKYDTTNVSDSNHYFYSDGSSSNAEAPTAGDVIVITLKNTHSTNLLRIVSTELDWS